MSLIQANLIEALPNAVRTSTTTGSAVDLRGYEGKGQVTLTTSAATAGTSPTLNVKLTECATSGGSYTDITGATFNEVTDAANLSQMIPIDFDACKGFLKVVATHGGTNTPTFNYAVTIVGRLKNGRNASQAI